MSHGHHEQQDTSHKKFFLVTLGMLFVIVAVFGVYKLTDAMRNQDIFHTQSMPESSRIPVSSDIPVSSVYESSALVSSADSVNSETGSDQGNQAAAVTGTFGDYNAAAQSKLATMTLKEKVGQVFIFRCPETGASQVAADYQPGGYCLMASNFTDKSVAQVQKMLKSYQNVSRTRMILCCDEEGGTVVRISQFPSLTPKKFRSPQDIFRISGMNGIYNDTVKKAQLLKKLGLNLNLAPVCDVSTNPSDFIYQRAFGKYAAKTADFVETSVRAYASQNMSCALKHFPGYGSNVDTHTGIAYDKRSYHSFETVDFLPFTAGIQAGAQCVLVSHNIVNCMDGNSPASLSLKVHDILRRQLGFTGIIMTDDLSMDAIRDYTGGKNPCVAAFQAGNDILLSSNITEDFNALYAAVKNGRISETRLNESVLRILAWKYKMGII
jgi:beta-N-acetylhexosaminidase